MRGGHCLKVWTKTQQVVSLSTAESDLYAAVNHASEGLGIQGVAKDLGDSMWAELTPGCLSDDVPGQPQRPGQSEARWHAEPVDTGGIQLREVRHEREPRRLDDEAVAKAQKLSN